MLQTAAKQRAQIMRNLISPTQRIEKISTMTKKKKKGRGQSSSTSFEKISYIRTTKRKKRDKLESRSNREINARELREEKQEDISQRKFSQISNNSILKKEKKNNEEFGESPHQYYFQTKKNKNSSKQRHSNKNCKSHNSQSSEQSKRLNSRDHQESSNQYKSRMDHQQPRRNASDHCKYEKNKRSNHQSIIKSKIKSADRKNHKTSKKLERKSDKKQTKWKQDRLGIKSNVDSCLISKFEAGLECPVKMMGTTNISGQKSRIDLKKIREDILDENDIVRCNLETDFVKQRSKNISMISKIASSMNLKRQTHSQAIAFLDKFLDHNTEKRSIKAASIAALFMALKVQHAETVGNLVYQFSSAEDTPISSYKPKIRDEKNTQQKKRKNELHFFPSSEQINELFQNPESLKTSSTNPKFNLNRPKLPNILTVVLSHEQIFSEYDRIICKEDISDMEMQMIVKFNFRLSIKSMHYWIVQIFQIWKQFALEKSRILEKPKSNKKKKKEEKFVFRFQEAFLLLIHLSEVCQLSNISTQFSKPIIVLSVLYLLIRILNEYKEVDKGFQFYRSNLGKSTNILFVDKSGINQYFGEFLQLMGLDMGHIVHCSQLSSQFFIHKIIRIVLDEEGIKKASKVGIYRYHSQMYRYFLSKTAE